MTSTVVFPANFPLTLHERAQVPDLLRAKATFDEYLELAEVCPYNLEYINGEIVSMSKASLPHEALVARLSAILNNLFDDDESIQIFGSNIVIHVAATGNSYNADVSIVQGEPDCLRLPSGLLSTSDITNPELVVEILSKSTMAYDLNEKLEDYKQIPSLRQVLFVSQHKASVSSYCRTDKPGLWLNISHHALTDEVVLLDKPVSLSTIYRKFRFD